MGTAATSKTSGIQLMPPTPGEIVGGKYSVLHVMAEGGMAWVVAAKHVALDEIVALKILKPEFAAQSEVVGRFAREAKAAMQIRSEHSVKIMDVGADPKRGPYLVMDHLEGSDLSKLLEDAGQIPIRRAVDIALQTCDALAHAHTLGIVHRDIKPENVFIVRQGDLDIVRVLDFGISKATMTGRVFDTDLAVIKTQSLLGSPVYMSPEQMRGKDVDHRVDIWSLGALLYEIVSGNVAFSGTSVTEICALVLETEPPPLSPELVPPAFAAVILKCLRKDPAARYQNVGELALALMPFGPSRSRIWAERVVALLRAHGADLDDSIFKSIPPPGMFSGPPNSGPPNSSTRVVISGAPSSDSMPVISSGVIPPSSALPIITADLRATAPSVAPERRSGRPIVIAAAIGALLLGLAAWALLGRSSPPHAAAAATTAESPPATVGVSSRPVAPIGDAPVQGSAASAAASSSAASPTSTAATLGSAPRAAAATGSGSAKPAWAVGGAKPAGTKPSASVPSSTGTGNTMHQDAAPAARAKIVDDAPRAKIVE